MSDDTVIPKAQRAQDLTWLGLKQRKQGSGACPGQQEGGQEEERMQRGAPRVRCLSLCSQGP